MTIHIYKVNTHVCMSESFFIPSTPIEKCANDKKAFCEIVSLTLNLKKYSIGHLHAFKLRLFESIIQL